MSFEKLSSNEVLKRGSKMVISPEVKKTSPLASKMVDERFPLPLAKRNLKSPDKLKAKSIRNQLYVGLHRSPRQNSDSRYESSRDPQKNRIESNVLKEDEHDKHLSILPASVDHNESPLGISGRSNIDATPERSNFSSKGSLTECGFVHIETITDQSKQQPSLCLDIESYTKVDSSQGDPSREKVICLQVKRSSSTGALHAQKKFQCPQNRLSRVEGDCNLVKGKRKSFDPKIIAQIGTSSVNCEKHGISISLREKVSTGEKVEKYAIIQKISDQTTNSRSNLRYGESSTLPANRTVLECETEMKEENSRESNRHLSQLVLPEAPEDSVIGTARSAAQGLRLNPQKSTAKDLPPTSKLVIPVSHEKVPSSNSYPKIMYDSIRPGLVVANPRTPRKPCNPSNVERECEVSQQFQYLPMPSKGRSAEGNKLTTKHMDSIRHQSYKNLEQGSLEHPSTKSRTPSPNRRFSFSLGRVSRSLSFKESSDVLPLRSSNVSASSCLVNSEASFGPDNSFKDNEIITNEIITSRGRTSPFRRLLDPILKPKAGNSPNGGSESVRSSKVKINSLNLIPVTARKSHNDEIYKTSTVQALLQITIRNGVPLFKFVVENSSNVLMATMTKLTSAGKNGSCSCQTFTLYAVDEIKKKSGSWMSQGVKDNSCGYVYNIAGQMKILSSCSEMMTKANSIKQSTWESTLYGVELKESDQETAKLLPSRELATIVVKFPDEDSGNYEDHSKEDEQFVKGSTDSLSKDRCFRNLVEGKDGFTTTVILPDGVHGLPNKGEPSTLLDRWRSGGSCDCGGWDVGCKLCVLSNQNQWSKLPEKSRDGPIPNRLQLFPEGTRESGPIFSLGPFEKGIFSVEFKSSISLLQAFFICIAIQNRQKISSPSKQTQSQHGQ